MLFASISPMTAYLRLSQTVHAGRLSGHTRGQITRTRLSCSCLRPTPFVPLEPRQARPPDDLPAGLMSQTPAFAAYVAASPDLRSSSTSGHLRDTAFASR